MATMARPFDQNGGAGFAQRTQAQRSGVRIGATGQSVRASCPLPLQQGEEGAQVVETHGAHGEGSNPKVRQRPPPRH